MDENQLREAFMLNTLFGSDPNHIQAASRRAYLDMCRTLRLGGVDSEKIYKEATNSLETKVRFILNSPNVTHTEYDQWHQETCNDLCIRYAKYKIPFFIGQAQKWLNMTMKYLYIRNNDGAVQLLPLLHVPLDQYVFTAAARELGIPPAGSAWSKINSYEQYLHYQEEIHSRVCVPPLLWEMEAWLREAKRRLIDQITESQSL